MRTFINFLIFSIQCILTFILIFIIYMIFVLLDYQGGIDNFVGTTIFQPIIGGLISIFSIGICLLLGLPIRIKKTINLWWSKNYLLSISGTFLGLALLIISLLPSVRETVTTIIDNQEITKALPNYTLVIMGWFLITFSTLHIFPPENFKLKTEKIIIKYTGIGNKKTPANSKS